MVIENFELFLRPLCDCMVMLVSKRDIKKLSLDIETKLEGLECNVKISNLYVPTLTSIFSKTMQMVPL